MRMNLAARNKILAIKPVCNHIQDGDTRPRCRRKIVKLNEVLFLLRNVIYEKTIQIVLIATVPTSVTVVYNKTTSHSGVACNYSVYEQTYRHVN